MTRHEIIIEYLRRSYQAVDGLWFVMVETAAGFDQALELDRRVWEVLAKIQARKAREFTGCEGNAPEDLAACFTLKLQADGHQFEVEVSEGEVRFVIHSCPWLRLMRNSKREHLALRVARAICPTEGRVWSDEFGNEYYYTMSEMACEGEGRCVMRFVRSVLRNEPEKLG